MVEATETLMRGRTTFLISHRPSTLQHCELQFELKHGNFLPLVWDVSSILAPDTLANHGRP
jgi:hypothetical protein